MPLSIDHVVRKLRTSNLDPGVPHYTPEVARAWSALTKAAAEWIDVVRVSERGSYDEALKGFAAIVSCLPVPPTATEADFAALAALTDPPRLAIEAPKSKDGEQ